jgi:Ni,Fe-hydrogenase III large subunit
LLEWSPIGGARLRRFRRRLFLGLLPGAGRHGCCARAPRALWLRALALEIERLANHLGDIGALANDAGFAFGLAQFSRLKEQLLRASEQALGQRYLMDLVVPGGTRVDLSSGHVSCSIESIGRLRPKSKHCATIYDEHAGLRDRFVGRRHRHARPGRELGLTGLAGRASGQAFDLRCDLPCDPYGELAPKKIVRTEGDVAARVAVRFDEVSESDAPLMQQILRGAANRERMQVAVSIPNEGAFRQSE